MRRTHERVQAWLPFHVDGTLGRARRRLLLRHLGRCEACTAELQRQEAVAAGFLELRANAPVEEPEPPDDLLDSILERLDDPGVRERLAGPARGAVSGARPELSLAAVVATALLAWLAWRAARRLVELLDE